MNITKIIKSAEAHLNDIQSYPGDQSVRIGNIVRAYNAIGIDCESSECDGRVVWSCYQH